MQPGFYEFEGASGRSYRFSRTNPNNISPLTFAHGVYILGKDVGNSIAPIYIGEADSIYGELVKTTIWNEAKLRYSADSILCHLLADPAARVAEKQDLVDKWHPPMN